MTASPLASAAERLRKPPGRPPRKPALAEQAATAVAAGGVGGRRLLDVHGVSEYLSVCPRIVHGLRAAGHLRPVTLPLAGDRVLGKLLFERADVDAFVDRNKE
jgi:hypothetical protein